MVKWRIERRERKEISEKEIKGNKQYLAWGRGYQVNRNMAGEGWTRQIHLYRPLKHRRYPNRYDISWFTVKSISVGRMMLMAQGRKLNMAIHNITADAI